MKVATNKQTHLSVDVLYLYRFGMRSFQKLSDVFTFRLASSDHLVEGECQRLRIPLLGGGHEIQ